MQYKLQIEQQCVFVSTSQIFHLHYSSQSKSRPDIDPDYQDPLDQLWNKKVKKNGLNLKQAYFLCEQIGFNV